MNNGERLKEIKSTRYTYLETSKTDLGNDFEWLIDRVEELEDEIWRDPRQAVLEGMYEENLRYREALEKIKDNSSCVVAFCYAVKALEESKNE